MSKEIGVSRENPSSHIETDSNLAHQKMILELGGVIDDYASPTPQGVLRRFSPDDPPSIYQSCPTGLQCADMNRLPPLVKAVLTKSKLKVCLERNQNFSFTPFIKMLKDCFT